MWRSCLKHVWCVTLSWVMCLPACRRAGLIRSPRQAGASYLMIRYCFFFFFFVNKRITRGNTLVYFPTWHFRDVTFTVFSNIVLSHAFTLRLVKAREGKHMEAKFLVDQARTTIYLTSWLLWHWMKSKRSWPLWYNARVWVYGMKGLVQAPRSPSLILPSGLLPFTSRIGFLPSESHSARRLLNDERQRDEFSNKCIRSPRVSLGCWYGRMSTLRQL